MNKCSEREALLKRLQVCDFALYDAALFLDSHPEDPAALSYYRKYQQLREQALEAYTSKFGPLTHKDYDGGSRWRWVDGPWPWQLEEE